MNTVLTDKGLPIPGHHLWTREKYERATALGLLGPEDHVELIEGEITQKMPMNSPHATALTLAYDALRLVFPIGFAVRPQLPLSVGGLSQPEPDVAVVTGSVRDYGNAHPTADNAVLVVEISDSTLLPDQTTKAGPKRLECYARAGIQEYWIVNLPERLLEVHRWPVPSEDALLGFRYQQIRVLSETDTITPLAAPTAAIAVADLLP